VSKFTLILVLTHYELNKTAFLLFSDSRAVSCNPEPNSEACSFEVIPQQILYNITLLVTNSLGRESETDLFNITDRGEYD